MIDNNTPQGTNFLDVEVPVEQNSGTNFLDVEYEDDRQSRLEKAQESKLANLSSGSDLQDSYTDLGNGWVESNSNKMWNDMSDLDIQSLYAETMGNALTTDESGRTFFSNGEEYTGSTRRAYLGGTKDGTNDEIKFGLARSDKANSAARYDPEQGGYVSGEKGIDSSNFETDVLLPYGQATMLESVLHGRKRALDGRVVKDLTANPNARAAYGGGVSEYYNNREALFGAPVDVDNALGKKLFAEYMAKLPASHSAFRKYGSGYDDVSTTSNDYKATEQRMSEFLKGRVESPVWEEIKQTAAALPAGVSKGALDLIDAGQEAITYLPQLAVRAATGDENYDIDLFNDGVKESVIEGIDRAVGYDRALDTEVMESAHKEIQEAGVDITSLDSIIEGFQDPEKRAHLGNAALTFLTDPSLTMSMITEVFGSGVALGAVTKIGAKAAPKLFSALESNSSKLKTAVAAATKAGDKAEVNKLLESYTLSKKMGDLVKGSVFTNADMAVRMNNDVTAFMANNEGESPDTAKLFEMAVLNRIVSTAEVISLKSLMGIKDAPAEIVKKAVKDGVIRATGKVIGNILKGGLTEGIQETTDGIVEQLNQKLDSSSFEGKSVADILSESSADILTGTLAGAASGVQLSGLSSAAPVTGKVASKVAQKVSQKFAASGEEADNPESKAAAAETASVREAHKASVMSSDSGNSAASYYSAQASGDPELKSKASVYASDTKTSILNGTASVFNSDSDKPTDVDGLADAVEVLTAEDGSIDYPAIKAAAQKAIAKKGEEFTPEIDAKLKAAHKTGKVVARIKTMAEVSGEVSEGAKGFITYYSAAKSAEHSGDTKAYTSSLNKLESFADYERTKLDRINSELERVTGLVTAEAEMLVSQGKAPDMATALRIKGKEYGKRNAKNSVKTSVKNSAKDNGFTTDIFHYDVALNLQSKELGSQAYSDGIYNLVKSITAEVSAMDAAYTSLYSEVSQETPTETEQETESTVYTLPEDISAWVEANPDSPYTKNILKAVKDRTSLSENAESAIRKGIETRSTKSAPVVEDSVDDSELPTLDDSEEGVVDDSELPSLSEDVIDATSLPVLDGDDGEMVQGNLPTFEDGDFSNDEAPNFNDDDPGFSDFDNLPDLDDDSGFDSEDISVDDNQTFTKPEVKTYDKAASVVALEEHRASIKDVKLKIKERKSELTKDSLEHKDDDYLKKLTKERDYLEGMTDVMFGSYLVDHIKERIGILKDSFKEKAFKLYRHFTTSNGAKISKDVSFNLQELFGNAKVTGFTVDNRSVDDVHPETKVFATTLLRNTAKIPYGTPFDMESFRFNTKHFDKIADNPATALMFNVDGTLNYGNVEAMHAAVNEYLLRDGPNLFGLARTEEDIAEMFGIPETTVSLELSEALSTGGTTLKLAAAEVGKGVIKNLGINVKEAQAKDALATSLGISALKGYLGTALNDTPYTPGKGDTTLHGGSIDMIIGNEALLGTLSKAKEANKFITETLGVDLKTGKTYRKDRKTKPREVVIHRAEHQNAPKDHTDVVNRLENTAFKFNSGNEELLNMFMDNKGNLNIEALVERIIGSAEGISNKDDMDSYKAQKFALERSLEAYVDATVDVGNGNLFFDWFIAKNHRMHLDSTGVNPQSDKHVARWLLTAVNADVDITLDDIDATLTDNTGSMTAKTFAYAIVQAFDGADDVPGIDKDNETKILESAKVILQEHSEEQLYEMAKKVDHVGHAALAIANIKKFRNSKGTFTSDMVMEVDGLTNGFAFRAMQFPVNSAESPVSMTEWLEKVGIVFEGSDLYDMDSMNGAKDRGQDDVYISTGGILSDNIKGAKASLKGDDAKWVALFEKHDKLPDFSGDMTNDAGLRKFIRNLMKSPVMIFGYAAGLGKISSGLVNDQVMGKGYLKGRGLISFLTSLDDNGDYVVTEAELIKTFKEKGQAYHNARVDLKTASATSKDNQNIMTLKADLEKAVSSLYVEPLSDTLELLFSEQTRVNAAFTTAGQFLFEGFSKSYSRFLSDKQNATEADKTEWLREHASMLPGVAGASSDDQATKLTFLKNILESTNNDVIVGPDTGKFRRSANTVTRTFGDPGVGPAVLTILSLDSSTLARSINGFYKDTKMSAEVVPVHDAIVLGVGDYGIVEEYSQEFYTTNRQYSVAEEFDKAMSAFELRFKAEVEADSFDVRDIKNKRIPFAEMRSALDSVVADVKDGREWLFSHDMKSGQMVGPEGTMHQTDIHKDKQEAVKYLSSIESNIMNTLDDADVKKALGASYSTYKKKFHELLEGCK